VLVINAHSCRDQVLQGSRKIRGKEAIFMLEEYALSCEIKKLSLAKYTKSVINLDFSVTISRDR
jgi:hypothetical protein